MKHLTIIIALLISNLTLGQIEKKTDTLEIWTFSVGNFVHQNAEKIIEKKWPFKIQGVAGDALVEGLIDSVTIHNNKVWNYLHSIGYSESKEKFESDLQEEIYRIKKAVDISQSNKHVFVLYENLPSLNLQNYTELKKRNKNTYEFTVYSYDLKKIEKEQVFEMKYITNLKNIKTRIVE